MTFETFGSRNGMELISLKFSETERKFSYSPGLGHKYSQPENITVRNCNFESFKIEISSNPNARNVHKITEAKEGQSLDRYITFLQL